MQAKIRDGVSLFVQTHIYFNDYCLLDTFT